MPDLNYVQDLNDRALLFTFLEENPTLRLTGDYHQHQKVAFLANPDTTTRDVYPMGDTQAVRPITGVAGTLSVVSDDVNDTAAGTGARTIEIYGLASDGTAQREVLTLDGTDAVDAENDFLEFSAARVLTSGSTRHNEGTLTVSIAGSDRCGIPPSPGGGASKGSFFAVPTDHVGVVRGLRYFWTNAQDVSAEFPITDLQTLNERTHHYVQFDFNASGSPITPGFLVPPLCGVHARVFAGSGLTGLFTVAYDMRLYRVASV